MQRSHRLVLGVATAVVASVSFLVVGAARAEDAAPGGGPPSLKKIDHPYLTAAVGEWAIACTTYAADGTKQEGKATSKSVLGVGGTALVEDYDAPAMMGRPGTAYSGHGVCRVSDDGKTVTCWWFDSMSPEPMKLSGPITDTTLEMTGEIPGAGTMKINAKKVDGGLDWEATIDGKPTLSQKYRKK